MLYRSSKGVSASMKIFDVLKFGQTGVCIFDYLGLTGVTETNPC